VDKGEPEEVTLRIFARAYTWNQDAPWEVAKKEKIPRYQVFLCRGGFWLV
jgi:hypothetical protein